jgi:glycosyltransferase involved in cell wall biosynthesis
MSKLEVDVLFYTHNQQDYVESGLQSILDQSKEFPTRIIILDDNSTDQTVLKIELWLHDNREKIQIQNLKIEKEYFIQGTPLGQTGTFKHGLSKCRADYFFILEGDDRWISNHHLVNAVTFLESNKWISAYGSSWISFSRGGVFKSSFINEPESTIYSALFDVNRLLGVNFQTLSAMCYRGDFIQRNFNVLNQLSELADLGMNIFSSQFGPLFWSSEVSLLYTYSDNSAWRKLSERVQIERSIKMLEEYSNFLNDDLKVIIEANIKARKYVISSRRKLAFVVNNPRVSFGLVIKKFFSSVKKRWGH